MRKSWFRALFTRRMIVAMLIIVQLVFFCFLVFGSSTYSRVINYILNITSLLVAFHILKNKAKNAYKIIWIFLILLFPVFGGMFYLFIKFQSSTRKFSETFEKIRKKTSECFYYPGDVLDKAVKKAERYSMQMRYLQEVEDFPVFEKTSAKYFPLGEEMFEALIEELKKAEKYIFLEYFIVQEGKMWNRILDVLEEKVREGVDVRVIYDDMGCFLLLPENYAEKLEKKGIKCKIFNPFRPFVEALQNNRDHRKIAVIDGKTAFTGGINLADEYINEIVRFGHWKDSAVMLKGDGAWSLTMKFLQMWSLCTGKIENCMEYYPKETSSENDGFVQAYCDSPVDSENVAESVYLRIINSAKDYLYITTPYLILDENIKSALVLAAKSGVCVKIITPGIWDKRLVHYTTRSYYRELIEEGIEVYEYVNGFMHSKTFVSDDLVATVGTVNLDYRSLYLHFECGVCLYESKAVGEIKEDFEKTLKICRKISLEESKGNPITRIIDVLLRLFAPLF